MAVTVQERLHATTSGPGGRAIVFANGFGTSQETWRHVVGALAHGARLVRFDYAGMTEASREAYNPAPYDTLHGYADDLIALLSELDVRNALLVGHSVGGMVGLLAAAAAPDRIGRLVLIAASPRYLDAPGYEGGSTAESLGRILDDAERDFHAWVAGFAPVALGPDATSTSVQEFTATLQRLRPDVALQVMRTIFLADYRAVLPRIRQPVTILQPLNDVMVPQAVGLHLHANLPTADLVLLASRGHVPQLTASEEIIAVLDGVVQRWLAA